MASEPLQIQNNLSHGCDGNGGTETVGREAYSCAAANPEQLSLTEHLMERVVELDNLRTAYVRVVSNKGAAGVSDDSIISYCIDVST